MELHPARAGLTAAQEAALVTGCDLQASLDAHPRVARVHGLVMRHYDDHALAEELEGGAQPRACPSCSPSSACCV